MRYICKDLLACIICFSFLCFLCVFLLNEGVPLLNLKGKRKEPYKMQLINHIMIKGHGSIMLLGNRGELNSK